VRIAALADVHGNLPALDAVLAEVEAEDVDLIVVCGDVVPGPMPAECLDRLRALDARYVMGNGDREVREAFDGELAADDPYAEVKRWNADRLDHGHRDFLAGFAPTVSAGGVLFCHASPRSDSETITILSGEERVAPMLAAVDEDTVVFGHTHRQFDRRIGAKRLINAGAIGMPYEGDRAARWLLLSDGEPQLRRTEYDVDAAVAALRATGFPDFDEVYKESLLEPADPDWIAEFFEQQALGHG
jgi:predicted phosphodiesterase